MRRKILRDLFVLGEYNPSTNEINKLDDDILVQLDGAGKIFE